MKAGARRRPTSLSRRLLCSVFLVNLVYWSLIAAITLHDPLDDVYALFAAHLAHTALALLRVANPDDSDPATLPSQLGHAHWSAVFNTFPNWRIT